LLPCDRERRAWDSASEEVDSLVVGWAPDSGVCDITHGYFESGALAQGLGGKAIEFDGKYVIETSSMQSESLAAGASADLYDCGLRPLLHV